MPCARLSWPFSQLSSARKYIVSYRIDLFYCYILPHMAWSVGLCVSAGHTDVLCKNGWTDHRCRLEVDSGGPKKACVRWGPDPPQKGAILGRCPAHWKALGVSAAVMLTTTWCHILLSSMKYLFLRCGLLSEFFDHLFVLLPTPLMVQIE